jgi:hypothetical protein
MSEIHGPNPLADDHDRILDCEFALEPHFQALVDLATRARWSTEDIALALLSLAANHVRANASNDETERSIDMAKLHGTSRIRNLFH